ncbi:MAG: ABC transporter permease [Saccharospirillum sp.]
MSTKTPSTVDDAKPVSLWFRIIDSDLFHSFIRKPVIVASAVLTLLIFAMALFAPWIAPHTPFDPSSLNLMDGFTPPMTANDFTGNTYLLGTDNQGRDVLSAIMYGTRISLFVGFAAVGLAALIGITLGLLAGYKGGWVDGLIMRIADVQLSFPAILLALLIFGVARSILPARVMDEATIWVLVVSIALSDWVQYARTVRSSTMAEKNKEYVQAARLFGVPAPLILLRHILPNVMGPVLVIGTIGLALAIILEATLSYLGVGIPPTQPSLGTLIRIGQDFLFSGEWWITLFPAVTLLVLALSVNLLGDWLRDALNPRLR